MLERAGVDVRRAGNPRVVEVDIGEGDESQKEPTCKARSQDVRDRGTSPALADVAPEVTPGPD